MQGTNPMQAAEARRIVEKAMHALEHALPRGTLFCCLIQAPGLNTIASNMELNDQLSMMREASQCTPRDTRRYWAMASRSAGSPIGCP